MAALTATGLRKGGVGQVGGVPLAIHPLPVFIQITVDVVVVLVTDVFVGVVVFVDVGVLLHAAAIKSNPATERSILCIWV